MRVSPRVFPSRLSPRQRRVYRAATVFYVLLFLALLWPVYPRFSGIEPRVFGMPFSLVYVVIGVLLSFLVLFALFRWERRNPDGGDGAE